MFRKHHSALERSGLRERVQDVVDERSGPEKIDMTTHEVADEVTADQRN